MQRSDSQTRALAPAAKTSSPSRDPRRRGKVSSIQAAESVDAGKDRASGSGGEDAPSLSTPQSTTSRLDNIPTILSEPSDFATAFVSSIMDAAIACIWSIKENALSGELKIACEEHKRELERSNQFPTVIKEAQRKINHIEAEYRTAKKEETASREKVQTSANHFIRLLQDTSDVRDEKFKTVNNQMDTLQKEWRDALSQHTLAREKSEIRLRRLEEDGRQQVLENQQLKKQVEELQSQQHDKDDAFRKSFNDLEQKLSSMRESVKGFAAMLSELQKDMQQVQETLKPAQQQAIDAMERVCKNLYSRVEKEYGDLRSDIDSHTKAAVEHAKEACRQSAANHEQIATIQNENGSLKKQLATIEDQFTQSLTTITEQFDNFAADWSSLGPGWLLDELNTSRQQHEHLTIKCNQSQKVSSTKLELLTHQHDDLQKIRIQLAEQANEVRDLGQALDQEIRSRNVRSKKQDTIFGGSPSNRVRASAAEVAQTLVAENQHGASVPRPTSEVSETNSRSDVDNINRKLKKLEDFVFRLGKRMDILSGRVSLIEGTVYKLILNFEGGAHKVLTNVVINQAKTEEVKHPRPPLSGNLRTARQPEVDAPSVDATSGSQAIPDEINGGTRTIADAVHQFSEDDEQDIEGTVPEKSKKPVIPQSKPTRSLGRQSKSTSKRNRAQREEQHIDLTQDSDEDEARPPKRRIRR
ncbi:hypothetical protein CLAIMM_13021 [Cladophialophora immunda]|nr:hypothetical protein CLAIMM_13021 [Cladophialophora immunda]